MKRASVIMCVVWFLGFCVSLAPLFHDAYFYDYEHSVHFFGRSAVCLPLQLSSERPSGWEYSVFIFLLLNGTSFLFILLSYVVMYRTIVKSASAVRSTRMNQDSTLAKRMMFIILTDFFCWFPVIIISILALTGNLYDPSKQVYAWIAVFVLPINSSINPLLYTFSTPYVRKKIPKAVPSMAATLRRRTKGKGSHKQFSSGNSFGSSHADNQTMRSPLSTPQSFHRLEIVNEAYSPDENMVESSFTESASTTEYCIRLLEEVMLFADEDKKSYLAVDVDEKETPCLIHVYKSENEETWKNTTSILSWLSLDGGHDNILPFLWSAKADKVLVEEQKSLKKITLELQPEDCLTCYELPSKQTLEGFFKMNSQKITEETVYCILNDLIEAIDYLSSKQIVHNAILPENIILVESSQLAVENTVLGGFHAAKFLISPSEDNEVNDGLAQQNKEELEINVKSFGNIIKMFIEVCPALGKFGELHDIMVSCLSENKPTTSDLLKRLSSMVRDFPLSDKIL